MSIVARKIEWPTQALDDVIALHRINSRSLGFFPKGAFEEHARAGQILLAINKQAEVVGYLLYRVAKQRAMIVHLCTATSARGTGVARLLVENLKLVTKSLSGIGLRCRQDYDARHVWAKFGFTAMHRKAGRSQDGHELTFWWFDHGHPDLFSLISSDEHRQQVIVDANVFFDLNGSDERDNEDSKALLADWVQASIELTVTKELLNEIDRADDAELRTRSNAAVTNYAVARSDDGRFQSLCEELRPLFPEAAMLRDESDLRQIAYAIAANVSYFVTRDKVLAERCESLYERFGLQVFHPAELIGTLDVLEREAQYRPARIAGSHLQRLALKSEDIELVVEGFRDEVQERVNEFRKRVLRCLSQPREIEAKFIIDRDQCPVFFGATDRNQENRLDVTILRASKHPLGATMIRNFLRATLEAATREARNIVAISDPGIGRVEIEALTEFGFIEREGKWTKLTFRVVGDLTALREAAVTPSITVSDEALVEVMRSAVDAAENGNNPETIAAIESLFWPAKIINSVLPTFIVSIRAEWAQHFFDDDLASQFLFGTREDLLLGIEGAYYCSAQHRHLTAPARILWYVSKGNDGAGSMSIKACSRLEEVVIGKPKDVFRRFRHLGVFQWKNVFQIANQNLANDVLAFRFSMTERFSKPFPMEKLETLNIRHPLLAPRRISDEQFATIYSHGCNIG